VSRQLLANLVGYWAAATFVYQPPRFGFSRSEQRLLSCGLLGGTDNEIANELGISLDVVKKTWRNIYDRVAAVEPGLFPNSSSHDSERAARGKAKK
jgi:DNA-binding CsgD family transcriptional regulator